MLCAQSPSSADEEAYRKALAIVEPARQLDAILQCFAQYPNSRKVPSTIAHAFRDTDASHAPDLASNIAHRLVKGTAMARSEADRAIAQQLFDRGVGRAEAEAYAERATTELNREEFVARERAFYPDESRERFRNIEAATWTTLARILIAQGRDAEARQALQKSLASTRTADAAAAFAKLAIKEGDLHTAIDALGTAVLTGKADRATVEAFHSTYAVVMSPRFPDPEAWLDRRYRAEFRNPIQAPPFRGVSAEPRRAVLLELFTGPACEPCIAVDLAVDALLQRYSRQDLVVIAHLEQRDAPAVLIDGSAIECGSGLASVTRPVFDRLDIEVMRRIVAPAEARTQLRAGWSGGALEVRTGTGGVQIHLVETEVSLTGENGIRLHPMVARSQAQADSNGYAGFHAANRTRLALVAVAKNQAGHVLQSAYLPVDVPRP
jgi:hypothetical protein